MSGFHIKLPQPYGVFQRNRDSVADITLEASEPVRARVRQGNRMVIPWQVTRGPVSGIPAGGPYRLDVELPGGKLIGVDGLLVGDLWVLAGQSNMDGCGKLVDLEPPSPMVHCFYYTEQWGVARDPLCVVVDSIDPVHWPCGEKDLAKAQDLDHKFRDYGAGLGVRFGKEVFKATGVPIGLIICSHGGTSMEQWSPSKKRQGGRSLYGSMLRRVKQCGGTVSGVLWYQGESDASAEAAPKFKARLKALVKALRADFRSPRLPFIQVQLSRYFVDETQFASAAWNRIQQIQLELASETDKVATAAAIDSTLSDAVHIDALSERRTGARLAELALVLAYGKKAPLALAPMKVRFTDRKRTCLEIKYKNLRGRLMPASDVWGFWVEDASGERIAITSAITRGSSVFLTLERNAGGRSKLWYGRGCNPTTNLHDDLFAAPVFGPVTI